MTDTGQIPGEGLPENAGMVEQPGVPASGAYTFLEPSDNGPEEDDLLLMPGAQGAWSDAQHVAQAAPVTDQYATAPVSVQPEARPVPQHHSGEYQVGHGVDGYQDYQAAPVVHGVEQPGAGSTAMGGQFEPEHAVGATASAQVFAEPVHAAGVPGHAPEPQFHDGSPAGTGLGADRAAEPRFHDAPHPGAHLEDGSAHAQAWQTSAAAPEAVAHVPLSQAQGTMSAMAGTVSEGAVATGAEAGATAQPQAGQDAEHQEAAQQEAAVAAHQAVHESGAHEAGGRDSGAVDLGAVRTPAAATSAMPTPPPARRPLHMGPPVPDTSNGVVRSLADRGPAGTPPHPMVVRPAPAPAAATTGVEYLDVPREEPVPELPGPQLGEIPPQPGAPWDPQPPQEQASPAAVATAETVVPTDAVAEEAPEATVPAQRAGDSMTPRAAQPQPQQQAAEAEADNAEPALTAEPAGIVADTAADTGQATDTGQMTDTGQQQPVGPAAPAAPGTGTAPAPEDAATEAVAEPVAVVAGTDTEPVAESVPEPVAVSAAEPVAPEAGAVDASVAPSEAGAVDASAAPSEVGAPQAEVGAEAASQAEVPAEAAAPEAGTGHGAEPDQEPVDLAEAADRPVPEVVAEEQRLPDDAAPAAGAPDAECTEPAEQEPQAVAAAPEDRRPSAAERTPAAPGYGDAEREAVLRVMRERRDIRNGFRSDPIPHEVLLRVLEAAHTAPSVGHSQPWDFVVIRSAETRRTMHELAQSQREAYAKSLPKGRAKQFKELKIEAILDTPVNIVVTADPTRGGRHTLGRHTQPQMAPYSSALAVENLWLAARAEGLGVGWVSFFDEREMVRTLGLPDHLEVVAYLCVGYVDEFPDEPELMQAGWSKRRPLSWVVHEETYGRRALPGEEPHDLLQETVANIRPLDAKALGEAWERQKRMTKPSGALGMLEIISAQLSGLSRMCPPPIPEPAAVAIFAGDHGVHAQGVTAWPQEVTGQMVANFLGGGAVCNAFANQVGAEVCVIDVGVASDLPATPGLLPRKVRAGTADFTTGAALTREEVLAAIEVGIETARDLVAAGNKALLTGEMGIANTTASAALISVYTGADPSETTGRGTGINDEMHARKVDVVRRALELHQPDPADPIGVLAAVGGLEHCALVGLILGGASLRTPVVLDGVSTGAAALVARAVAPEALAACIAGHRSAEPGHVAALNKLGLRPLVDLDLRLGEGTGALLALPVVQSAARAMHEVATFDSAGVTEK